MYKRQAYLSALPPFPAENGDFPDRQAAVFAAVRPFTLSQKNKWQDDEGRIYIIYPIAEIAEILDKGSTTIKGALNELDMAGLLERERGGFSAPNRLYVKVPRVPQVQFSDQLMAGKPPLIEPENRPTDGQKTDLMMVGKPSLSLIHI